MSEKTKLFITFIFFIILCGLVATTYLVISIGNTNDSKSDLLPQDQVDPEDEEVINRIEIDGVASGQFMYATISPEDTVVAYDQLGKSLIINLEKNSWQDISWSNDGELIAILSQKKEADVRDINIYDFYEKEWKKATDYFTGILGVESYRWFEKRNIVFAQGDGLERWLHRLRYDSGNEIIKLTRIEGDVYAVSKDHRKIIVMPRSKDKVGKWKIFFKDGTEAWDLDELNFDNYFSLPVASNELTDTISEEESVEATLADANTQIKNIWFNANSNFLIFEVTANNIVKLFRLEFKNNGSIEEITEDPSFKPICGATDQLFMGYKFNEETREVEFMTLNINSLKFASFSKIKLANTQDIVPTGFQCYGDLNLLIRIDSGLESTWHSFNSKKEMIEIPFLKGAREVKINPVFK